MSRRHQHFGKRFYGSADLRPAMVVSSTNSCRLMEGPFL